MESCSFVVRAPWRPWGVGDKDGELTPWGSVESQLPRVEGNSWAKVGCATKARRRAGPPQRYSSKAGRSVAGMQAHGRGVAGGAVWPPAGCREAGAVVGCLKGCCNPEQRYFAVARRDALTRSLMH